MKLSEMLTARGFVHQHTGASLSEVLDDAPRTIYHGIDPSADSAHAGNMVVWVLLRHLALAGHKIIFLVGGGTGMIGDPKPDAERVLQDESVTDHNVQMLTKQAELLIGSSVGSVQFINNKEWLASESLLTFLRDIGKHFTVNELVKKDAIAKRLESDSGISYTEFAYPLLQAFDYLTLYRRYGCDLQVGGSDQWGNIVAGVDLVRRKEQAVVHALTVPLIVDRATGKKFGKSEGNAVWLNAEKTTPFAFYQFWLNTNDESVEDFLKLFTFLSLEEIQSIIEGWQKNPGERRAQRALAHSVTAFVHGEVVAQRVENASEALFGNGTLQGLSSDEVALVRENAPLTHVAPGTSIADALVASELATSKREARTFIESGAVSVNGEKVTATDAVVPGAVGTLYLLKRGKKNVSVLELA